MSIVRQWPCTCAWLKKQPLTFHILICNKWGSHTENATKYYLCWTCLLVSKIRQWSIAGYQQWVDITKLQCASFVEICKFLCCKNVLQGYIMLSLSKSKCKLAGRCFISCCKWIYPKKGWFFFTGYVQILTLIHSPACNFSPFTPRSVYTQSSVSFFKSKSYFHPQMLSAAWPLYLVLSQFRVRTGISSHSFKKSTHISQSVVILTSVTTSQLTTK